MKNALLLGFMLACGLKSIGQHPFLYAPLHQSVVTDGQVTFTWKDRPMITSYTLEVATDSFFVSPQSYVTASGTYTVSGLAAPQTYWWRVREDSGPWSAKRSFQRIDMHAWGGLALWYRADLGVTAVNDLVTQWADQGDSARTAAQPATATQPQYLPSDINGLPTLHFGKSGVAGQHTFLNFSPINLGTQYSFFSLYRPLSNTFQFQFLTAGPRGIYIRGNPSRQLGATDLTSGFYTSGTLQTEWAVWSLRKGTAASIRKAQVALGTTNVSTGTPVMQLNSMGYRPDQPADQFLHAKLPEFFFFSHALPDSLTFLAEKYLTTKYARPVRLPYDTNVCAPNLTLTLPGGTEEYTGIIWSTGATTASINLTANGTYWVRATSRVGNYLTTDTIRVRGIFPTPLIMPNTPQYFCFNRDTLVFERNAGAAGVSYTWFNGSTEDSLLIQSGTEVYYIAYDTASGCLVSSDTVPIYNKTKADFDNLSACPGVDAEFADLSMDLVGDTITSWAWNFGDPATLADTSTDTNGVWNYAQSGTYSVYLKITTSDGCADSVAKNVTVKPTATADFNWQGICYGKPTQFFDESVPETGTQVTGYQWTFGPGITSSFVNPAVTFDTADVYDVTLKVFTASGCTDTVLLQVPVNKGVDAAFAIPDSLCAGQPVSVADQSQGVNDNITQWVWRFGNNAPISGQTPQFAFQGTGNRIVRLTATTSAGCADSVQKTVFVRPSPTAAFAFAVNGGTPPFTPGISNQSTGATAYAWDYGNGFTDFSATPVFPAFADTGTYSVTLAVSNPEGCTDTVAHDFVVFTGDRTLQLMDATCVLDGDYVTYTARVLNKGALEVNRITFGGNLDYNSVLREKWEGTLFSGQVMEYVFNSSAKYFTTADFCCVRIEDFNDTLTVQAPDNEICMPLTDNAWFSTAYPTPTDGTVTIDHTLPFADALSATLCSVEGKTIRSLFTDKPMSAGFGSSTADISDLRAGLYVVRFTYRDKNYSVKVLKK